MLVRELLGQLDGRQRMIVYLRFFGQLSQSEIAERVGISQVHVSRLLRSSMTALRDLLDDRTGSRIDWTRLGGDMTESEPPGKRR